MDRQKLLAFTKTETEMINACRLFLQATTVAEISNHQGTTVLRCAHLGKLDEQKRPALHSLSKSLLQWPNQEYPSRKAWKISKSHLCH
jgi:hypothetical protein